MDAVADDLVQANCYYKLFREINDSVNEYKTEMNQSRVFWSLTRDALLDAAILRLCRVYERRKDKNANSLGNLLNAIKQNPDMFEFEQFRVRVETNKYINAFESWKKLDESQLESDILFVSETNSAVKNLIYWRDKEFVHRDSTIVIRNIEIDDARLPTYSDYDSLLETGLDIVNRYSSLFHCCTYGRTLIGGEDYTYILKSLKKTGEAYREKLKAEFNRHGMDYNGE
ncbi:MAG: hypothetical protein KF685_11225 [Acidobacteria bacterium]|nr:hypothetical protein [Acidobacteriota bacterium]